MSKHVGPNSEPNLMAYDPIAQSTFYVEGTEATGAINVNASFSPSGTQDVNLTKIGGVAAAVNAGSASNGTLRTVTAADSPEISLLGTIAANQTNSTQKTLIVNGSGTIAGVLDLTDENALGVAVLNANGDQITNFATSTKQSDGTQVTQLVDAGGDAVTVTGGRLDVNATVSGGSGTSAIDNSAFTAGTTSGTPSMGFYHSAIDTVTDGRAAVVAITSKRAQHISVYTPNGDSAMDDSLDSVVVSQGSAASLKAQVIGAGSAGTANAGVVTVQGIASMTPVQVSQATAASLNATVIGAGSAGTANAGVLTIQGITSMTPVQVSQATASNLNATVIGAGSAGTANAGVVTVQGITSMTPILATVTATNLSTNIAQVNGATVNVGTGAAGTGTQRVTTSTDSTIGTVTTVSTVTAVTTITNSVAVTVAAPTAIFNGLTNVTTAGTRVTLAASQAVKSVAIKARSTNTGTIYVGNSSVASTNGIQLLAGETVSLNIANLNTVNIDSSVNGEGVTYIAT